MRRWGAALLGVLVCAALVAPLPVHAKEPSSVTVVSPAHAGPLVEEAVIRLSAELRAAGFSVRRVEGSPSQDGRAQVEGEPEAASAKSAATASPQPAASGPTPRAPVEPFATIAIVTTERGAVVDMWVADHVTKKTLVRRIDMSDAAATNAASDLAVRTVELLQASLLEVGTTGKEELPADLRQWIKTPKAAPPPPRAPIASIEAAFAVLAGGSFGVAPLPLVRVAVVLPRSLSIRAAVAPAITTTTVSAAAGTVALRQTVAALDLAYGFGLEHERVYPVISLGGGIYDLRFDGQPVGSGLGHQGSFFTAALAAGAGVAVRILPHLAALADLQVLALQSEPTVTILGSEVGRAGRPTFLPSLGLVAAF